MATLYSNELKAVVIADNFTDNPLNVLKEKCLTIQHFDYQCEHKRNASGDLYGVTNPVILKFTVRVNSPAHSRIFYQNLVANNSFDYSFLFNPTFNAASRLSEYEDGMIINAYVVSVEENYNSAQNKNAEDQQIELDVTLLARSATYLGRDENNDFKSEFIK